MVMDDNKQNGCGGGCGCGGHGHEHKNHEGCCGGHGHNHEHEHEHEHLDHDVVTLVLESGAEIKCPVIDIFEVNEREYIALLHPVEETALLYRFEDIGDGTIDIETINDDVEFDLVSKKFLELQEEYE